MASGWNRFQGVKPASSRAFVTWREAAQGFSDKQRHLPRDEFTHSSLQWAHRLLLPLGYCNQHCSIYFEYSSVFSWACFQTSCIRFQNEAWWIAWWFQFWGILMLFAGSPAPFYTTNNGAPGSQEFSACTLSHTWFPALWSLAIEQVLSLKLSQWQWEAPKSGHSPCLEPGTR